MPPFFDPVQCGLSVGVYGGGDLGVVYGLEAHVLLLGYELKGSAKSCAVYNGNSTRAV